MNKLPPPPRLSQLDPLESELYDMVKAAERGFVQFPPASPPADRTTVAQREPGALGKLDGVQVLARALSWVALAISALSVWYLLK